MIKIVIAEDNNFLAQSLINKLGLFDEFKIKFHSLDGEELISSLKKNANIDIILMDIQMPNMNGIEATNIVSKLFPHIQVLMLTIMDSEQHVYEAIQAGAKGYLLKESSPVDIHDAILKVMSGGASMSPEIALKAMNIIQDPNIVNQEKKEFNLTEREKEVLYHMSKGSNYNEIASNLVISPNTVRTHTENIYKKLKVHNKVEALKMAYKNRLI